MKLNYSLLRNYLILCRLLLSAVQSALISEEDPTSNSSSIDFFLSRDKLQKQVYEFEQDVLKVVILDLPSDNSEFTCNVRQSHLSISTESIKSFPDQLDSSSVDLKNPLLFSSYNSAFLIVSQIGQIVVYYSQDSENTNQLFQSYPSGLEDGQVLVKAFLEGEFIYLISKKKSGVYLKTFVVSDLSNIRNVQGEQALISELKNNEKIICIRFHSDQLYLLNSDFILFIFQIDKDYKLPKLLRKVHIQNLFLPLSFDVDDEKVFLMDKEKGVFSFNITELIPQQIATPLDLFLKVERTLAQQNQASTLIKPLNSANDYFLLYGKYQNHNFISEVQSEKIISTSTDEPELKQIIANPNFIVFISDDSLHIMHRGIDQNLIASNEKKFSFEILEIQSILIDPSNENNIYILTLSEVLLATISKSTSSISCHYKSNQKDSSIDGSYISFSILKMKQNHTSCLTDICQQEMKVNVKVGQNIFEMNSSAFLVGFLSGVFILLFLVIIYLIHKKQAAKKSQKYHNFDCEDEASSSTSQNAQINSTPQHSHLQKN